MLIVYNFFTTYRAQYCLEHDKEPIKLRQFCYELSKHLLSRHAFEMCFHICIYKKYDASTSLFLAPFSHIRLMCFLQKYNAIFSQLCARLRHFNISLLRVEDTSGKRKKHKRFKMDKSASSGEGESKSKRTSYSNLATEELVQVLVSINKSESFVPVLFSLKKDYGSFTIDLKASAQAAGYSVDLQSYSLSYEQDISGKKYNVALTENSFRAFTYFLKSKKKDALVLNLSSIVAPPCPVFALRKEEKIKMVSESQGNAQKQDVTQKRKERQIQYSLEQCLAKLTEWNWDNNRIMQEFNKAEREMVFRNLINEIKVEETCKICRGEAHKVVSIKPAVSAETLTRLTSLVSPE